MKEFCSFLAPQIHHFIRSRQASQRWNDSSYEVNLMLFDRFCHENYPGDTMLSREMVDGWCHQRDTETNNSCRSRIYVVDSFVRFLNSRGLSTVQPPQVPRKERRTYIPHAFTPEELSRFFQECDHIPIINNRKETIIRKMTISVFFQLLYSSGIRTNEARLLSRGNVDLERGILNIQYSKGHDQHYIFKPRQQGRGLGGPDGLAGHGVDGPLRPALGKTPAVLRSPTVRGHDAVTGRLPLPVHQAEAVAVTSQTHGPDLAFGYARLLNGLPDGVRVGLPHLEGIPLSVTRRRHRDGQAASDNRALLPVQAEYGALDLRPAVVNPHKILVHIFLLFTAKGSLP